MEPTEGFILAASKDPDPRESQTEDREHQGTASELCVHVARDTRTSMLFKASSGL